MTDVIQHALIGPDQIKKVKAPRKKKDFTNRELVGRCLQLGGGRQSSAIVEMVVEGDLPRLDFVIFADTGDEPSWVYQQVWYLAGRLASVGIPLYIVRPDTNSIKGDTIIESVKNSDGHRFASMPVFTGPPRGPCEGMLKRQCTNDWKIQPSMSFQRKWLVDHGYGFIRKDGARVIKSNVALEVWFGISAEEGYRATERGPGWHKTRYPMIERNIKTSDALRWLRERGLPVPKKSSCVVCPYHEDSYWLNLKENHPDEFEHACSFDDWLRSSEGRYFQRRSNGLKDLVWLHRSCVPLREVDFQALITKRTGVSPFQRELVLGSTCATDGGFSCMS